MLVLEPQWERQREGSSMMAQKLEQLRRWGIRSSALSMEVAQGRQLLHSMDSMREEWYRWGC